MTQNDISYYAARMSAKNDRLKRKETKRHDLAQEALQHESNVASQLGSEARMLSASAASKTADTNQKKYELDWEREYGWQYGTDIGEAIANDNFIYFDNDPESKYILPAYDVPGSSFRHYTVSPVSYDNAVRQNQKIQRDIEKIKAERIKTIFDTANVGGKTVEIVQNIIEGD